MREVVRKAGRISRWLPVDEPWRAKFDWLMTLVRPDWEARYKGFVLGNLWLLLNQLSQLLIYTYVFSIVLKAKLGVAGWPAINLTFALWLFARWLPWIAFTSGLSQTSGSVVGQPNLVSRWCFCWV